jgi:hypothetical protein
MTVAIWWRPWRGRLPAIVRIVGILTIRFLAVWRAAIVIVTTLIWWRRIG